MTSPYSRSTARNKHAAPKIANCFRSHLSITDAVLSINAVLGGTASAAYDLVEQCHETGDQDARVTACAGGIVLGWHERDLVEREPKLSKRVRRFGQLDPFW